MQFDDSPHLDLPSTPQPHHATLPADSEIPRAVSASPTTSMLVVSSSSPPVSFDVDNNLPAPNSNFKSNERSKYNSPPPPSSSMTPPPSSQPLKRRSPSSTFERDATPTPAIFSSPPPTTSYGVKRECGMARAFAVPTSQQIASAPPSELRELLQAALNENSRLDAEVHEARMSAAHYKLQHNLLTIETEEATKRMEVEHEMTRREVEVLQAAEVARRESSSNSPAKSTNSRNRYITELKSYCETMDNENALLHGRLERAKKIIAEKEEDITDLLAENRRYIDRIRENRDHMRLLKSSGAVPSTPQNRSQNFPTTPQYARGTPKHTPHLVRHHQEHENQGSFATLLLADRVLNDQTSAPSTPTSAHHPIRQQRHSRGVHSLSSLPATPIRSQHSQQLLPAVQFIPQSEPRYRAAQTQNREFFVAEEQVRTPLPPREMRRKSRDSTISASDAEELAASVQREVEVQRRDSDETEDMEASNDDIQESQASATASAMLRRDPRESFEVARSPEPGAEAAEKGKLLQARIFGNVTKAGLGGVEEKGKRKRLPSEEEIRAKKLRMAAGEGVGLGIYGA